MLHRLQRWIDCCAWLLAGVFLLDRLLKLLAVERFFRRPAPAAPQHWPTVSLIQPVTRSMHDLRRTLATRFALDYPAQVQHLFVCDEADTETQALCRALLDEHPWWGGKLLLAPAQEGRIAIKTVKLNVGVEQASGEILAFVDDDIGLRPDALRVLVAHLGEPRAGAVFGLACYTEWANLWSSLMSVFVNSNALLSYIPLTFLTEPYTVTGHCFALRRQVFEQAGGFTAMAARLDDDHEIARRVRALGLRCVQTPMIYDAENVLPDARSYQVQMRRWFVFPREMMLPSLSAREKQLSGMAGASIVLPPLLGLLALATRRRAVFRALGVCLGMVAASYGWCEHRYLKRTTPLRRWLLLPLVTLVAPVQMLAALLGGDTIEWRGQRLRVKPGGAFEVLS